MGEEQSPELLSRHARRLLAVLARRWSLAILGALEAGALRHNEIRSAVVGVADKVLVETLRALEAEGLLTRTVYAEVPPRVEYRLTDAGDALRAALGPLNEWAQLAGTVNPEVDRSLRRTNLRTLEPCPQE